MKKAKEIKILQDQVARYKRKDLKRAAEPNEVDDPMTADVSKVNKIILV